MQIRSSSNVRKAMRKPVIAVQKGMFCSCVCVYRYGDDPTIMAWDLINEPRCYKCGNRVQVLACLILLLGCAHDVICSVDDALM